MSRNIHFTPQHSKSVAPPASETAEDVAARTLGVDANTYWTDKDYTFGIVNRYAHARWYRLTVTKLQRGVDYTIYTSQGRLDEDVVFEVAPGDEFAVTIAFGGDQGRDPRAPVQFEIYVQEYVTQDEDSPHEFVMNEMLRWIPRPNPDTIFLTTPSREIRVRPWPWKQRVKFEASLVNRSYLPITANVRALPGEDGVEAGLEGAQERLGEAVPPLREQPVLCDIMLEKRLTKPVLLTVDAQTRIPDLEMDLTTSPKTVQITPIGFLKVWHDYLVVALGFFLFVWLFFGMPPVVRPTTLLTLDFEKDLPQGVKPADLKVTLEPINTTAFSPREGKLLNGGDKNHLVYAFDWGWMRRGLRLTWNTYNLRLKVDPQPQSKSDNPYGDMIVAGGDVEKTTISEGGGVSEAHIRQPISFSTMKPAYIAISSGEPRAAFTYTVTEVAGGKQLTSGASKGEAAQITVPMEAASRRVTVDVAVNNTPRESRPLTLASGQSADFGAWKTKEDRGKDAEAPGKNAVDIPVKTPPVVPLVVPKTPGDVAASSPSGTPRPVTPKPVVPKPPPVAAKSDPDVAKWCELLSLQQFETQMNAERGKNPLHLAVEIHRVPGADKDDANVNISVTPTESCWCQIYDIDRDQKIAVPFLAGMGVGMDGQPEEIQALDASHGRPIYLIKGKSFKTRQGVKGGYLLIGALAVSQPADAKFDMDLLPWMQKNGASGFAIGGAAYP